MNRLKVFAQTLPSSMPQASRVVGIQTLNNAQQQSPKYSILPTLNSNIVNIKLLKGEGMTISKGALLAGLNTRIDTHPISTGNIIETGKRTLAGGSLLLQEYISQQNGSVMLQGKGEVAIVEMDASSDLIYRSDSFLFASLNLDLSPSPIDFGLKNGYSFGLASTVKGNGETLIGLSRPNSKGLVAVSLSPKEEFFVAPSSIVAWDSHMHFAAIIPDSPAEKIRWKELEFMTTRRIPFRHAAEASLFYSSRIFSHLLHFFRYRILGERGAYRFVGPGKIIISCGTSK